MLPPKMPPKPGMGQPPMGGPRPPMGGPRPNMPPQPGGGQPRVNPQTLQLLKQKMMQRQRAGAPPQAAMAPGGPRPPMAGGPPPGGAPMGPGQPAPMGQPPQGGMPGAPMQGVAQDENEKLMQLLQILKAL